MNYYSHNKYADTVINALIVFITFLFTFSKIAPDFGVGLDTSYSWALNHLYANHFDQLQKLIFPLGPLGFLRYSTTEGHNLAWALAFYSIIKLTFIALLFQLSNRAYQDRKITIPLILIVSYVVQLDFAIIGTCALLLLQSEDIRYRWFIPACILASISFFIKSSTGISASSVVIAGIVYHYYNYRNLRKTIAFISSAIVIFTVTGWFVTGNLVQLFHFTTGTFRLAMGYSNALSLSPDNNWFVLSIVILTILLFPFLKFTSDSRRAYFLLIIPLFFSWKHSMSREDISHIGAFLLFLLVFWGIVIAHKKIQSHLFFFFPFITILFFYRNMSCLSDYKGYHIELSGINNFFDAIVDYKKLKADNISLSKNNLKDNELDPDTRSLIGNSSIDIYPWELSYVPANEFNWQPRTMLQSGSFTSWYDHMDSISFTPSKGPEFILFQLMNGENGTLYSLDGRYILNDEPITIKTILTNYSLVKKTDRFLLFKKSTTPVLLSTTFLKKETTTWDTWIDVPLVTEGIESVRIITSSNLLGKIKSFLYKGEEFYIDYQFANHKVVSYRYIPSNALDGLWINPLITDLQTDNNEPQVTKIRLRTSNTSTSSDVIDLTWQKTAYSPAAKTDSALQHITNLLGKKRSSPLNTIKSYYQDFESNSSPYPFKQSSIEQSITGHFSSWIGKDSFSLLYSLPIDSIKIKDSSLDELTVEAGINYLLKENNDVQFAIVVEQSKKDFWHSNELANYSNFVFWKQCSLTKKISLAEHKGGLLKVFVWNKGSKHDLHVDNFYVDIKSP